MHTLKHLWRCVAALATSAALLGLLAACGGSPGADVTPPDSGAAPVAQADVQVLMLGNSHTVGGGLPDHLATMLRASLPGRSVAVVVAPGFLFLDERLNDPATLALLYGRRWQAVVLQAQKYSSSGLYSYSTTEAEQLVRRVRAGGATPLLFPEWPRRGIDEAARIWALHTGIAARAPACVAAVPQAWQRALELQPGLILHASDGNHANETGAWLAALMLHGTLTGLSPLALPDLPGAVPPALQRSLRQVADEASLQQPPREHCPADAPVVGA